MGSPRHQFSQSVLLAMLQTAALLTALPVNAQGRCAGVAVAEVRSLAALPEPIRKLLPSGDQGLAGIAERGQRFNATDVVIRGLPSRRFALAAVGPTCAVIAVEYGGIARRFELTEYRLLPAGWQKSAHGTTFREPLSVAELLTWP